MSVSSLYFVIIVTQSEASLATTVLVNVLAGGFV